MTAFLIGTAIALSAAAISASVHTESEMDRLLYKMQIIRTLHFSADTR